MFGSQSAFFYEYIAGIQSPSATDTAGGYDVVLSPQPHSIDLEVLSGCAAYQQFMQGTVSVSWQSTFPGMYVLNVSVPPSMTALTRLYTAKGPGAVLEGGQPLDTTIQGIMGVSDSAASHVEVRHGSGHYSFTVQYGV